MFENKLDTKNLSSEEKANRFETTEEEEHTIIFFKKVIFFGLFLTR